MKKINQNLENGLKVSIDWLSFTVFELSLPDALELFGYTVADFSEPLRGAFGYKTRYVLAGHGVTFLSDGSPGMGIHVDVSGKSVGAFLTSFLTTCEIEGFRPEDECYSLDIDETVLCAVLKLISEHGHVTRLDVAVDDVGCHFFSVSELACLRQSEQVVSNLGGARIIKGLDKGNNYGETFYLGSPKSDVMLRVYDKQAEQNRNLSESEQIQTSWIRWELQLRKERAKSVADMFKNGLGFGMVAVGVLGGYIRIINLDDSNRTRCSMHKVWKSFLADLEPIKLHQPVTEKTMDDKREWLIRQVVPTLTAVIIADGGSMEFIEDNLVQGLERMKRPLYEMAMLERESQLREV